MTLAAGGEVFEAPGHCEEGEKVVAAALFPADVVDAVRHHHDRWDSGGEKAPINARILAVCERYEALTAGRGCARLSPADTLAELRIGAGIEFDPAVIDALARAVQDGSLELNLPDVALPAVVPTVELVAASS